MKTPEELNALKEEVETLNEKLAELTEDELAQVVGGNFVPHDGHVFETTVSPFTGNTSLTERPGL